MSTDTVRGKHLPGRHNQLTHAPWGRPTWRIEIGKKPRTRASRSRAAVESGDVVEIPSTETGWHWPQQQGDPGGYRHVHTDTKEMLAARRTAFDKARRLERPSRDAVADNKRKKENNIDLRGNALDRENLRWAIFVEFGGHKRGGPVRGQVPCVYCGLKLSWHEDGPYPPMELDKILVAAEGGRYQRPNIVPSCQGCNRARGDTSFFSGKGQGFSAAKPDWYDTHVRAARRIPAAKRSLRVTAPRSARVEVAKPVPPGRPGRGSVL